MRYVRNPEGALYRRKLALSAEIRTLKCKAWNEGLDSQDLARLNRLHEDPVVLMSNALYLDLLEVLRTDRGTLITSSPFIRGLNLSQARKPL